MVVDQARHFDSAASPGPNRLVIRFKPGYALFKSACERPEQVTRFEQALAEVTGQPVRVEFALAENEPGQSATPAAPAGLCRPTSGCWRWRTSAGSAGERVVRRPADPS